MMTRFRLNTVSMTAKVLVLICVVSQCLLVRADCYTTGVLKERRLVGEADQQTVFARVESEELYGEFRALLVPMLKRAGRLNIRPGYLAGLASIKYDSPDNLDLRSFAFDDDVLPGEPVENVKRLCSALEESGVRVAGGFAVAADPGTPEGPAGVIFYLTERNDIPDREIRLRYFKFPDPEVRIGRSLLEKAGVRVVIRRGAGAVFYIGKRLGIYVLKSDSARKAAEQAADYKDIVKNGKETLIGMETDSPAESGASRRYVTKIYTYR